MPTPRELLYLLKRLPVLIIGLLGARHWAMKRLMKSDNAPEN